MDNLQRYSIDFSHDDDGFVSQDDVGDWVHSNDVDKLEKAHEKLQTKAAHYDELVSVLNEMLPIYKEFVTDCGHDPSVGIDCSQDFAIIERAEEVLASAKQHQ